MNKIDKLSAIQAAAVTVFVLGVIALIIWSAGPGPDWILPVVFGAVAVVLIFVSAYVLISTR